MIKKINLLIVLFVTIFLSTNAQIAAWNFDGVTTTITTANANPIASNTNAAVLSRGAGLTATSLSNAFASSGWDGTSLATAISNNDYFEFTLSAQSGFKISLTTLESSFRRSGTGPNTFQWRYNIGSGFVDLGTPISYSLTTSNGDAQTPIPLTGVPDLQNVANPSTIVFRLYGWGGAVAGTFAIGRLAGNDLNIGGSVASTAPVPTLTTGTLPSFSSCVNATTQKTLVVSGTDLTGSPIVFGPLAGYTFSLFPAGPFNVKDSIQYTSNSFASTNLYIRRTPLVAGSTIDSIPAVGGGVLTKIPSTTNGTAVPTISIVATPITATVCAGGVVKLNATGNGTSYTWNNGISNNTNFTPSASQTYIVTATDASICSNTSSVQVVVNTLPTITATPNSPAICMGGNVTLNGGGAGITGTYVWDNSVTDNVAFYPTSTATYNVIGTDVNGCSNTSSTQIVVNQLPTITANATLTAVCAGKPVTFTGGNGVSYLWSNGVVNNTPFYPTATQTYMVTGTDANTCTNTATIQVTLNNLPTVTANASSLAICEGASVTLNGGGAMSYSWNNGASNNSPTFPTTTTIYEVIGTDGNTCSNTSSVEIIVNLKPSISISTTLPSVLCEGSAFTIVGNFISNTLGNDPSSIIFSGGMSVSGGLDNNFDGANETFTSTLSAASNNYLVTATDIAGCTSTSSITISNINPSPTTTASVTPTTVCLGQTATLTGSGTATTYTWDNGQTNNNPFTATTTTTYMVTGADAVGCTATSTVQLVVNSLSTNLVSATSSSTINQLDGSVVNYTNASCELISTVDDGASGNVLGSTLTTVTLNSNVGTYNNQPYVRRWYEITPSNNGPATITLYFTQADFDNYNSNNGTFPDFPTSGNNADPNISNIRITKVTGSLGTGSPTVITPSMNWNGNYWEATFPVTSFSQFYLHAVNPLNAALPVTILDFNAQKNESLDIISWKTANESNNDYFTILYSTNGTEFSVLANEKTKAILGNSQSVLNYSIENKQPQLGHNYYQLEQTDIDGKKHIASEVIDVVRTSNGNTVSIYPNPVKDEVNIKLFNVANSKTTLLLTDLSGRVLKEMNQVLTYGTNILKMNVADLATGIYAIQVVENGIVVSTSKISK